MGVLEIFCCHVCSLFLHDDMMRRFAPFIRRVSRPQQRRPCGFRSLTSQYIVVASAHTMANTLEVTIPPADDFHHHFRDGEVLKDTVQHACRMFRRAVSFLTSPRVFRCVVSRQRGVGCLVFMKSWCSWLFVNTTM